MIKLIKYIFFKVFADCIVIETYLGIQSRLPNSHELRLNSNRLKKNFNISQLISDLSKSEEHWQSILNTRSMELLGVLYTGFFKRKPDPGGIKAYCHLVSQPGGLEKLIKLFLESQEFKRNIWIDYFLPACKELGLFNQDAENKIMLLRQHLSDKELQMFIINQYVAKSRLTTMKKNTFAIFFVYREDSTKEKKSLFPVYEAIQGKVQNVYCDDIPHVIRYCIDNLEFQFCFIVAIEVVATLMKALFPDAKIIYIEHGTSPIKSYTYGEHYKYYDHVLLPGKLWVSRLETLYPELIGKVFDIGYPPLKRVTHTDHMKMKYFESRNFDPQKKTLLFAPTWSDGDLENGIYLTKYLIDTKYNLFVIPHEGDREGVHKLAAQFPSVAFEDGSQSIDQYYPIADILITDISSTAIEFARLGKPVLCIKQTSYSGYDSSHFTADGTPSIPLTNKRWSDFFRMFPIENLLSNLDHANVPDVTQMCSDFGDDAANKAAHLIITILNIE